jgi:DNA processing protein
MLVEKGWSIVSGLAIGVDTEAHRQAIAAQGHTVAILANGLDKVYPRENKSLAEEILANGGALVSEQPFGMAATPTNLVQRDRLQSGMSVATIVMQTDIEGGSMHTARFTLTQRRRLLAPVPTGIHASEAKSQGILALTQKTGRELSSLLKKIPSEYADLLQRCFPDRPPAMPIASRDDYDAVIAILTTCAEADAVVCDDLPNDPPSTPDAKGTPEAGPPGSLF